MQFFGNVLQVILFIFFFLSGLEFISSQTTTVCGTAASEGVIAALTCPLGSVVTAINFASYGTATGTCGGFVESSCHATTSVSVVSTACLNRATCSVSSSYQLFTYDPCVKTGKHLYIQATCGVEVIQTTTTVCGTAASEGVIATLTCPTGYMITAINFASYGTATGTCGGFVQSSCHATTSVSVVSTACLNHATCSVSSSYQLFTYDPCIGTQKHLYIQATCGPNVVSE